MVRASDRMLPRIVARLDAERATYGRDHRELLIAAEDKGACEEAAEWLTEHGVDDYAIMRAEWALWALRNIGGVIDTPSLHRQFVAGVLTGPSVCADALRTPDLFSAEELSALEKAAVDGIEAELLKASRSMAISILRTGRTLPAAIRAAVARVVEAQKDQLAPGVLQEG